MRNREVLYWTLGLVCFLLFVPVYTLGQSQDDFAKAVSPLLSGTCAQCHNDRVPSGGLNVGNLADRASLSQRRTDWEKILQRVRAGEMPPTGVTKPSDAILRAFTNVIQTELDRADAG